MDNYLDRLYEKLPRLFRNADAEQKLQLKRYLDILVSGGFHPLHEETENILSLIDVDKIPNEYLPLLASALGFRFPYNLDEQTQKIYIINAVRAYKIKGTRPALEFMIRELTKLETNLTIDDDNRVLYLDVASDFNTDPRYYSLLQQIDFIIEEFCPPYGYYEIRNQILWDEILLRANQDMRDNENDVARLILTETDQKSFTNGVSAIDVLNDLIIQVALPEFEVHTVARYGIPFTLNRSKQAGTDSLVVFRESDELTDTIITT